MREMDWEQVPSGEQLEKNGLSYLTYHISNHGGWRKLRESLGEGQVLAETKDYGNDPIEYYKKNHNGLSPTELKKVNEALYSKLRRENLLDQLPRRVAKPQDFGDNPLAFYHLHYPGLTRGQLYKENTWLYQRLYRTGIIDQIPSSETSSTKEMLESMLDEYIGDDQ